MINAKDLIGKFQYALDNKWGYIWGTAGTKWTKAKQEALEQTTDPDRAQGRKYGSKWIGRYVADCSGLFSWAFKELGGYMYHGSNTMYLKYCADKGELKKGRRTDGKILLPGTAVFVWNGKTYSHVGLYIGDGTVIEAQGTLAGVTTSKVEATKWSHWGELTGVSVDGQPAPDPQPEPQPEPGQKPTLRKGDKGPYVTLAQTELINRGYGLPKYGADRDFGNETLAAVKRFQEDHGLQVDGVIGPATWEALDGSDKMELYTVHIPMLPLYKAEAIVKQYNGAWMTKEGSVG